MIHDIYLYIGAVVVFLVILYGIITMIRKCIKNYKKDEQIEQSIFEIIFFVFFYELIFIYLLATQSNRLLTEVSIIRRNSSIRNSLVPNRRSSLDIRFQMESRARRLSQLHLIPLTTRNI